jgi:streptogramin lyase
MTPPAPAVTAISPATGPSSGGVPVTITGANLIDGSVKFGGTAATSVSCGDTTCTATSPALAAGTVDVTVTTGGGTSATTAADRFTVSPVTVSVSAIPGVGAFTQPGGGQVYAAADGSTWFAMPNLNMIGKIASDGTITTHATLDTGAPSGAKPDGITQTPDGTTWYTEDALSKIVSIDSGGTQHGYQIPGDFHDARDLTTGPDGRLWFTMAGSGAIGAMTAGGAISLYPLPDPSVFPNDIRPGPDGRLWFTETLGDAIGAITTSGHVTEYPIPPGPLGGGMAPFGIAPGPDGRMWFADGEARALGAITSSGVVTSYPLPSTIGQPHSLAAGPDGRLWFTESGFDEIFAFSPATGAVADYPLPPGSVTGTVPDNLAMAKDGSLWVDEGARGGVFHVTKITTGVAPAVTFVTPGSGPVGGGTAVTITGTNLTGATAVMFGSKPATGVTVLDAAHVRATAPAGSAGPVDVKVTTPSGTTAMAAADRYYYGNPPRPIPNVTLVTPATGSIAGGAKVTIKGTSLAGGTVAFGSTAAAGVTCSATSCTATAPKHAAGTVDVRVHTASGTSPVAAGDTFTYQAPPPPRPVVTSVSPASGPPSGGNAVTIKGRSLAGGIVSVGLTVVPATCTATACTVTMPPGAAGTTTDVRVTTAGGISAATSADRYTYRPVRSISATLSPSSIKKAASATWISALGKALLYTELLDLSRSVNWLTILVRLE